MTDLRTLVLGFAAAGIAGTLSAQAAWERVPLFPNTPGSYASGFQPGQHRMVWDPSRQRVMLVNGFGDVWEWNGSWANVHTADLPPSLISIAYDTRRQRTVLYSEGLTWEWDGTRWTQRFPATSPPFRSRERIVYDEARGRVVLFGGQDGQGRRLSDTWEWDGVTWVERLPAVSPPARFDHAMTYDAARSRVVLFGGASSFVAGRDTWVWDGSTWKQLFPVSAPPRMSGHDLAYDAARGRVVLFGGSFGGGWPGRETWEWDGSTWTLRAPATVPASFTAPALAYHHGRQRVVLWGGNGKTWEWDGNDWTVTSVAPALPLKPPVGHAFVYDAGSERSLLLAEGEHWEWNGTSWIRRGLVPRQTRYGHAAAYDAARQRVVLYGGFGPNETWEWDGTTWVRQPVTSPSDRYDHAMTYDASRGRVVMFGGFLFGHVGRHRWSQETWEWDGTRWQQRTPATAPSPRGQTAMAYDAARQRTVLFGGSATSAASGAGLGDTWEWDGTTWTRRTPANAPPPRLNHTMTYDSGRGRVVLFGGRHLGIPQADTWEWDGDDWVRSATITLSWQPSAQCAPGTSTSVPICSSGKSVATYDAERQRVVMFDSISTWEYDPHPSAAYAPFGSGCAGPAGVPQLAAALGSLPWAEGSFTARLAPIAPGHPAVLFFGVSSTSWSGIPLPLSLAALGRPDCQVVISLDFAVPLATAGSAATLTIPRLAPSLVGGVFYNQGASLDLTAGIAGLAFSNGARAQIGAR